MVHLDEAFADGQPQARTAVPRPRRFTAVLVWSEFVEDARQFLLRNPLPRVFHARQYITSRQADLYRNAAFLGEARGVHQQVQEHLPDAQAVQPDGWQVLGDVDLQVKPLGRDIVVHHIHRLAHQHSQIDFLARERNLPGIDTRKVDHVVHQRQQMLRAGVDGVQVSPVSAGQLCVAIAFGRGHHHLAEADNQVQWRAQFVADAGGKLRLEAFGLGSRPPGNHQRRIGALKPIVSLVEVTQHPRQLAAITLSFLRHVARLHVTGQRPVSHHEQRV